jgi:hypothetical protein
MTDFDTIPATDTLNCINFTFPSRKHMDCSRRTILYAGTAAYAFLLIDIGFFHCVKNGSSFLPPPPLFLVY